MSAIAAAATLLFVPQHGPRAGDAPVVRHGTQQARRSARPHTPRPLKIRVLRLDDEWIYRVSLNGSGSHGRTMLIDQPTWLAVAVHLGTDWNLTVFSGHELRVTTSRSAAGAAAGDRATGKAVFLSRWIAGATRHDHWAMFRNGDQLDLRRSSLVLWDRSAERALPLPELPEITR